MRSLGQRFALLIFLLTGVALSLLFLDQLRAVTTPLRIALFGRATVEDRLATHGPQARARLLPFFEAAGVSYPPAKLLLLGLKQERQLQVYAGDSRSELSLLRSYPVLAASGNLGPKLAEGDRQVPEGLYRIESLNPNSRYHLSLRVDYPNRFDQDRAKEDGRAGLGGDIMIHGAAVSVGCLAMGDRAAEDLFVLVAEAGRENVEVILSPVDFRRTSLPSGFQPARPWVPALHSQIRALVETLPPPVGGDPR